MRVRLPLRHLPTLDPSVPGACLCGLPATARNARHQPDTVAIAERDDAHRARYEPEPLTFPARPAVMAPVMRSGVTSRSMTDDVAPVRATPTRSGEGRRHVSYQFGRYADGNWWKFRDVGDGQHDHRIENTRIRVAAIGWAKRNGRRVESRTERRGAELYLRFVAE